MEKTASSSECQPCGAKGHRHLKTNQAAHEKQKDPTNMRKTPPWPHGYFWQQKHNTSKSECIWFSDFIMILLWCCTIIISILVLWPLKLSLEAVVPPAYSFLRPWQCVGCRLRLWLTPQSHSSRHSAPGSSDRNPGRRGFAHSSRGGVSLPLLLLATEIQDFEGWNSPANVPIHSKSLWVIGLLACIIQGPI